MNRAQIARLYSTEGIPLEHHSNWDTTTSQNSRYYHRALDVTSPTQVPAATSAERITVVTHLRAACLDQVSVTRDMDTATVKRQRLYPRLSRRNGIWAGLDREMGVHRRQVKADCDTMEVVLCRTAFVEAESMFNLKSVRTNHVVTVSNLRRAVRQSST